MSTATCLLRYVQQSADDSQTSSRAFRFRVSGRIDDRGGRIAKAELVSNASITASTPHATVVVDLKAIPTHAPWPKSKNHDDICAMIGRTGGVDDEVGPYPYPDVDNETVFFIPSEAVVCKLKKGDEEEETIQCEGSYYCETDAIRLDAVDQDKHHWFWMSVEVDA